MTTQEEKILYWIHYHGGSATKDQIRKHLANMKAEERNEGLDNLVDSGLVMRHKLTPKRGRPTERYSMTYDGWIIIEKAKEAGLKKWYTRKWVRKEEGRIE